VTEAATSPELARELEVEQAQLDLLYGQLDGLRERVAASLKSAVSNVAGANPSARTEREAFVALYSSRLAQLMAVESRLCFGRMDLVDGTKRYVGRIGLADDDRVEQLIDWRAPAAEPFYRATAAHPLEVVRRRQLATRGRRVAGVQDEVLDLAAFEEDGVDGGHVVLGEGALFASLEAARSARMGDIVATIQADQDQAIRAPLSGVLVVQGGPGTGKTAVALHRAAYLLYANRERIARTGVLLVGPNRVFLNYISEVLPTLGETDTVVTATPGELYPGVATTLVEPPAIAVLKGDLRMADVVAEAVRRRQRTIDRPRRLRVDGTLIRLQPGPVRQARDRARRSGLPHNEARVAFVAEILRGLVRQLASARGTELDADNRVDLMAQLYESRDVRREVNWCWAPISPQRLLRDLFANDEHLIPASRALSGAERDLLHRDRRSPWTVSDVALLDEAAELLGDVDAPQRAEEADAARRAEVGYADAVQDLFGGRGFISAEDLATRYADTGRTATVAERAVVDRGWAFGHVVVDEAQELSPMMWRTLMRRVPTRSLTVVGDVAQTGSPAGAKSWSDVLSPHVEDRWQLAQLTVNYRTPAQIMDVAASVVHAGGLDVQVPTSARIGKHDPEYTSITGPIASSPELLDVVRTEWTTVSGGTLAVITPPESHQAISAALLAGLPSGLVTTATSDLGAPISVLTVHDAKGLEFDTVVLVEPAAIIAESDRGLNDLYVALTRPTQRLHVLHSGDLPPGMG
jgi:DNA helicase IV